MMGEELQQDNLQYRRISPQDGVFDCSVQGDGFQDCAASEKLKSLLSMMVETSFPTKICWVISMFIMLCRTHIGSTFFVPWNSAN